MNKRQKYMSNSNGAGWCQESLLYAKRFVPQHINSVAEGEAWVVNDELLKERMDDICAELGHPDLYKNVTREQHLAVMFEKRRIGAHVEAAANFEPTDVWRLVDSAKAELLAGAFYDITNTPVVQYDDNSWWFAKSIDGSVLNNAAEVEEYQASIIRQRKYHDAEDDMTSWRVE